MRKIKINCSCNSFKFKFEYSDDSKESVMKNVIKNILKLCLTNPILINVFIELMNRLFYSFKNSFFLQKWVINMLEKEYSELFKKHCFYKLNTKKKIQFNLCIPKAIDLYNIQDEVNKCYKNYYIRKKSEKMSTNSRREAYIKQIDWKIEKYYKKPDDYSKKTYRLINSIRRDSWLKISLKKINKIFTYALYTDYRNKIPLVSFIHSNYKKRSYKTNAETVMKYDYVLAIDMSNFYPSITNEKLYSFLKGKLKLPSDISKILSLMCTIDNEGNKRTLGQGLPPSGTLAIILNLSLFEYINKLSSQYGLEMVVYVDDITFGSQKPIPQEFINKLFGLIKGNDMKINKRKFKSYNKDSIRKITGLYIKNNELKISYSKKEEMYYQYNYLNNYKDKLADVNEYLDYYAVFLRFKGNLNYEKYVENVNLKKYQILKETLNGFMPDRLCRINKNKKNELKNLGKKDIQVAMIYFMKFQNYFNNKN